MSFKDNIICETCMKGKQVKTSFKSINEASTERPLKLIHLNLFGPSRTINGKWYNLIKVDYYSR